MIQPEIMEDHDGPIVPSKLRGNMAGDIVVYFVKVLANRIQSRSRVTLDELTNRHKEACGSVCTVERVREEGQPGIITVHQQFPRQSPLELCENRILMRKGRHALGLGNVQNHVRERRHGSRCYGLHTRHRDRRGAGMSGKGKGSPGAN